MYRASCKCGVIALTMADAFGGAQATEMATGLCRLLLWAVAPLRMLAFSGERIV